MRSIHFIKAFIVRSLPTGIHFSPVVFAFRSSKKHDGPLRSSKKDNLWPGERTTTSLTTHQRK